MAWWLGKWKCISFQTPLFFWILYYAKFRRGLKKKLTCSTSTWGPWRSRAARASAGPRTWVGTQDATRNAQQVGNLKWFQMCKTIKSMKIISWLMTQIIWWMRGFPKFSNINSWDSILSDWTWPLTCSSYHGGNGDRHPISDNADPTRCPKLGYLMHVVFFSCRLVSYISCISYDWWLHIDCLSMSLISPLLRSFAAPKRIQSGKTNAVVFFFQ